jgi:hypothetical protein
MQFEGMIYQDDDKDPIAISGVIQQHVSANGIQGWSGTFTVVAGDPVKVGTYHLILSTRQTGVIIVHETFDTGSGKTARFDVSGDLRPLDTAE